MNKNQRNNYTSPADKWRDFVQAEIKAKSKLGNLLENSTYGGYDNNNLTVYFPDDDTRKKTQGQLKSIQDKLKQQYNLFCDRISFTTGSAPVTPPTPTPTISNNTNTAKNPLQALYWIEPNLPIEKEEAQRLQILNATVTAEKTCYQIYTKLSLRTEKIAGGETNTLKVQFNWRLRVGGTRGFRELLLPVLHPVFGIPYIPASTLKGAARTWAMHNNKDSSEIQKLLGMLEGDTAKAAQVEFLDAFPTKPCLSLDVATPQWTWNKDKDKVTYQPVPHSLLSLESAEFLIGLRLTTRGENNHSVQTVKQWLENALADGIGSRVSGGYGRTSSIVANSSTRRSYEFEFWTQGMYGSNPPSKENNYRGDVEFRPTAVRGILRYWFRAVAMGLYNLTTCQTLEETLFGKLGQQGKISITTKINPSTKKDPYFYSGKIYLEAESEKYLNLAEKILILATHLGGIGRGSRRPLHLLDRRMRGCHWEIITPNSPLPYNQEKWRNFFQELNQAFEKVQAPIENFTSNPGTPKSRLQDVLDKNAQIWLLKSPKQIPPKQVTNWQEKGNHPDVLGTALTLLYNDTRFKGKGKNPGNPNVGGALEIPSFVWIKSVFDNQNSTYQVVTIFGSDYPDRHIFAKELKNQGAILAIGNFHNS